ncbi:hypothetical protein GF340_03600, partial [Candidatus Peregrinibacteria bacterium]|nr:hypothetical protein [Candidatus Peregrinibacteria bacterium]
MGLEDAKRNIEQSFASLEEAEEKDKSGLLKEELEEHEDLFYEVEDLVDLGGFLNLQTEESKKYYEKGLKEVESTMYDLAAEGQDILKDKKKAKEKIKTIDSLAGELDSTLGKYKPTVEKLSRIDTQVNKELEIAEERMIAIEKIEKRKLENNLDFDEESYEIYIDEAIDSFGTVLKLYNTIGNLPEAFRDKKKNIEKNVKKLAKKEIVVKQTRLIRDKYGSLVEMEIDYDNKDDGSYEIVGGEIIPKEEFYKLSFLDQRKLIVDLRSIEFEVADNVDEEVAPIKAESFYEGRKLYEQGKYQDAKLVLELFIKDAENWNTYEDGERPSNLDDLVKTAGGYLNEINESLGKQEAILNARGLIERGDLHGATTVLKNFIEEKAETSDAEMQKNVEAAKELMKRIELTIAERTMERLYQMRPPKKVVTTVRAGERTVINPQYKEWHTYYQAARDVHSALKEGKHNDFSSAYEEVLKNKGQYYYQEGTRKYYEFEKDNRFNVLEDEKMLENLPHGYLQLARKYRKAKQYDIAEQYFLAYFEKDLVKVAQKRLTFEQYKKKVDSDVGFNKELADIVAEHKKLFEKEAAEKGYDPATFNEAEIREKALLMLYQKKLPEVAVAEKQALHQAHPDSFNAYDKEVWAEFMDMKGQTWKGSPLELFDMSDADWDWLKYQLAIDIGMIAISGFGGSLLKKGTGFALAKIRDNTLRRKMVQELAEAGSMEAREQIITKYRFMQEAELALGKGAGQSAYTRGARTLAGAYGGTAIESFGFSVSHATLNGARNGRFNVIEEVNANWQHDMKVFAILGASGRVSHSLLDKFLISKNPVLKTAGGLGTLGIEANAMALANGGQLTKHDVAMILGFRAKRLGIDKGKRAIDYLRESSTENLKVGETAGNKETASALGVSDIYFGKFGENLEVGGKPAEGFMDASSRRIHYNMTYLNEGNLAPHLVEKGAKEKIMPEGYKLENKNGETVVNGPKGEISLHEFFKLPEGNNLMTALRNTATHEKTQRYVHKKSGQEVILEDGRKIIVEDGAKTESVKSLFTVAGETGKIKLELPDGRKLTDKSKVTWVDIEEFIAHVADGSKKLSEFEKAKLLKEIKKFAPEFEWNKGRQLDTKELINEGTEAIGREREAARIVAEAPPLEAEKTPRPKSPDSGVRLKGEIDWQKGVTFEDLKKAAEGGKDQAIAKKILYDLISISKIKDPELRKQTVESLVKKYGIKDRMELYTLIQQVGSEVSKHNDVVAEGLSKSRKQKQPSLYLETELDAFGRELARSIISESKRVETILIDGDPSKLMKAIQTGIVTVNKETLGKLVTSDKGWKMMRDIMENNPRQQRLFNAELSKMDLSQSVVNADSLVYIAMQKNAPEVVWGLLQEGKIKGLKDIPESVQTELLSRKEGVAMLEKMMTTGAVKSLNELSLPAKMSLTNSPEGIAMIRDSLRVGDIKGFEKMPDALKLRLADTEGGYQLILDLMA